MNLVTCLSHLNNLVVPANNATAHGLRNGRENREEDREEEVQERSEHQRTVKTVVELVKSVDLKLVLINEVNREPTLPAVRGGTNLKSHATLPSNTRTSSLENLELGSMSVQTVSSPKISLFGGSEVGDNHVFKT